VSPAKVTRLVLDVVEMDLFDDFECRLLTTPVAGLLPFAALLRLGRAALFRRVPEEQLVAARKLVLQLLDMHLKLQLFGLSVLELEDFALETLDHLRHFEVLGFEHLCGTPQQLDVLYLVDGHNQETTRSRHKFPTRKLFSKILSLASPPFAEEAAKAPRDRELQSPR